MLRRTYRDGKQVKHETLGNISHLPLHLIELVRRALKGETFVPAEQALECVRSVPHGHVAAILGTLRKIGLDGIIGPRRCDERERAIAMVVARLIAPRSKLATARGLAQETASTSLGEELGVSGTTAEELYEAMDWLLSRQERIENALARRHLSAGTLVLYDVTSTYFEGRCCPLARRGHAHDGKKGKLQIVFGLLCNEEGCPVAVEVFAGNTADPQTVANQVRKIRERFRLDRVVIVGDRGMLTEARIREDLRGHEGMSWITALRFPAIRRLAQQGAIQRSLFDEQDLAEVHSPDYPGERLIVCRNPLLAAERRRKRGELLSATEKELEKVVAATKRSRRPLRGKVEIGLRVGRVVNRYKMAKHFKLRITATSLTYERREERIAEEEALDGMYVIRTDLKPRQFSAEETVRAYKRLSRVERAFRSLKTVDLRVRPIHHRRARRVRAHVFLCVLAYYVEWHMRRALAPMLFDDEEPEAGEALRASIVAPAQRSPSAIAKARCRTTGNGQPVHSFHTLIDDLGTIVKNELRTPGETKTFRLTTLPTPVQRRAFDLLGISRLG
ncbi:MAG: IS1634 family transposase [Acidobacteria bacterium]|nr:IS1634 family transposase [Acidobacteriota bacterium]